MDEWSADFPVPGPLWTLLGYGLGIAAVGVSLVGYHALRVWKAMREY